MTQPTRKQLEEEDRRRSEKSVREMYEEDLADPTTPSRRSVSRGGQEVVVGFELDLTEWRAPDDRQ